VKEKMQEKVDRRGFFGSAGKGLALGVGAVVTAATGAEAAVEDAQGEGYRETKHIKTYYETARY